MRVQIWVLVHLQWQRPHRACSTGSSFWKFLEKVCLTLNALKGLGSRMPWAPLDVSASGSQDAFVLLSQKNLQDAMGSFRLLSSQDAFVLLKLQDAMGSSRRFGLRFLSNQDAFVLLKLQDAMGSSRRFGLRFLSTQDAFVLLSNPGCFVSSSRVQAGTPWVLRVIRVFPCGYSCG